MAAGCAVFVAFATLAELVSSLYANSDVPAWAEGAAPISWPRAARVVWWLAVAVAAAGFHACLHRLGIPTSRLVAALTVGVFVLFAVAIAAGADWATFH